MSIELLDTVVLEEPLPDHGLGPRLWASTASLPVGTCRYSSDSTIDFTVKISSAVSWVGVDRGQLGWSSSAQNGRVISSG